MIPIEILKQVSVVYCHGHCPDGLASAMILKDAFRMLGMEPKIEFVAHDTPEYKIAGVDGLAPDRPLFCDIAPSDYARQIVEARGGIVLDHHVGKKEIVETFGELGVYADAEKEPGVSGAVLAFREVFQAVVRTISNEDYANAHVARIADFADAIGARDTWRTDHPLFMNGQWISKLIMSKPAEHWLEHGPVISATEIAVGQALFEAHMNAVREAVDQCVYYLIPINETGDQISIAVFQEQSSGFRLSSDVAEHLRQIDEDKKDEEDWERVDVIAGFSFFVDEPGDDPRVIYSLRGNHGFDVCEFAKLNGGGGHKAMAGFSVAADLGNCTPYEYIRQALKEFLVG